MAPISTVSLPDQAEKVSTMNRLLFGTKALTSQTIPPTSTMQNKIAQDQSVVIKMNYLHHLTHGQPAPVKQSEISYSAFHIGKTMLEFEKMKESRNPLVGQARPPLPMGLRMFL